MATRIRQSGSLGDMAYSTSSYPYDTVVRITDTIGSQSWQGSGVLISPDEVLTASHVVYIQGVGTANNIVVTPGYDDGSSPYGSADGTYIHYFPVDEANRSITNEQSQYDYAVIHLSTPFTSAGYMGIESNFAGGSVNITGYPASAGGAQIDSTQSVIRDPNYSLLDGTALGEGSSGGPVWIESAGGPSVVGVVSSESNTNSTGYNNLITTAEFNQIEAWVQQDDSASSPTPPPPPTPGVSVLDTTTGLPVPASVQPYTGPVSGLTSEYITATTDSLNISVSTPNWYIHSGSGNDAIAVDSGTNVIDGSTGSNFLTGGTGNDTFFVDDRNATADIWSTAKNFHSGDAATIWGVTPSDFALSWMGGQGAAGYTGLTLHATAAGLPTASLTLAGFTSTDLTDGKLTVSYGTTAVPGGVPGSTYMYVHAT
jgi:V8-like Glu-specific endopeptidase